jgi:TIGR03086 family protein
MLTTVDVREIYARCSAEFATRVHAVDGRWDAPTPLPGWNVRELVNHLVNEERWTPPLFAGSTTEEVGSRFDGDLLGDDPVRSFDEAAAEALAAVRADGALERSVHLSFGDHPGSEYAMQLAADHLVHAIDLARALGADETLDAEAVAAVREWFGPMEPVYRDIGVIGPRVEVPAGAGPQAELLGMMGRTP